jgi:hypothetical protein
MESTLIFPKFWDYDLVLPKVWSFAKFMELCQVMPKIRKIFFPPQIYGVMFNFALYI